MAPIIVLVTSEAEARRLALEAGSLQNLTPAARARKIYRDRRAREHHLGRVAECFHDPAWDILLDLFCREAEGAQTSITSACIGSAVAGSTALRVLNAMCERGALRFENDPVDARRRYVRLTEETRQAMQDWLQSI